MTTAAEIAALVAGRPDAFAGAADTIGGERAQLLAAMAQAGSAGRAAYEQAKAAGQAQRQQAIAALAAQLGGMPTATRAAAEASLGATAAEGAGYLAADEANWANAMGASQTSNDAYLGRLATVLPQMKSSADAGLTSNLMDSWAEIERAIADNQRQTAMQIAQLKFNKSQQDDAWAREERMRDEAWAREDALLAAELARSGYGGGGGSGGGRGGGGGGSSSSYTGVGPLDPTDPYGGLSEGKAYNFADSRFTENYNAAGPETLSVDMSYDPGMANRFRNQIVNTVNSMNANRAQNVLDQTDWDFNGGNWLGVSQPLLNDDNYNLSFPTQVDRSVIQGPRATGQRPPVTRRQPTQRDRQNASMYTARNQGVGNRQITPRKSGGQTANRPAPARPARPAPRNR